MRKLILLPLLLIGSTPVLASSGQGSSYKDDLLPEWLKLGAEYRVQTEYIDPMELSGTTVQRTHWTEQRLRLDIGVKVPRYGGVVIQLDVLDGVLFGDNGAYNQDPATTTGVTLTSYKPNDTAWRLGLAPDADPLAQDSYVPVLRSVDPIQVNHAYGEVYLPFGLLRIGRQPYAYGAQIASHDQESTRINRWGVSRYSHSADRVLFGTKIDQIILAIIEGLDAGLDPSTDRGVILAVAYDWGAQDDVHYAGDNLHQVMFGWQWRVPEADWFGVAWSDILVQMFAVHRFNDEFDSAIWGIPFRVSGTIGPVSLDAQYVVIFGGTREVAEGFAVLSSKEPRRQELLGMGAHLWLAYQLSIVEMAIEVDWATGDDDPRPTTDLTVFSFDRDFNVGLLLFEHAIAFASARSAAVGIENLFKLASDSFPLTEIATDGRVTNAVVLFPQVKVDIVETERHRFHTRFGALFAWPSEQGGAVDAVNTILREDGLTVEDDAVNYEGGDPGDYWGTELDLQLQWTYADFFIWTVEAAVLFPGNSLQDANGHVVPAAFLVDNRFTFVF